MEKQYKPLPNVDKLRYKGTKDNPDIKIFVSHRIDLDSAMIDNPLYIPVRCGAIYDKNTSSNILGDDTGDNISEKRMSYCELTVQYWAWKNIKADYYGICHYRRYISFSSDKYHASVRECDNGCVTEKYLDEEDIIKKHGLDPKTMSETIKKYDLIAIDPIKLQGITNYEAMRRSPDYHNMDDVDYCMDVIRRKYPKMIKAVDKYMLEGDNCWLYNCWIMNNELFQTYSAWLFDVLSEVEKHTDYTYYSQQMNRTPGTLAERLFGVFVTYVEMQNKYKVHRQQLIFFENTEKRIPLIPFKKKNNIAIASNFNNNYASVFGVLLQSIIENMNCENNYDVIVLSRDITKQNKEMLTSMAESHSNVSVRFVNPEREMSGLSMYVANAVYTDDMYIRVLIPHILSEYDKVLVLDADMVCETDVAKLYNTDIGDCWAGAVRDVVYYGYLNGLVPDTLEYAKKVLKLSEPYNYCNTGVILFNCKKIREQYSLEYLQHFISTHSFRVYEQDTLNVLIDGHMYFLDRTWNTYTYTNDFIEKCVFYAPLNDKEEYLEARKSPQIIHYAAHPKPWWTGDGDYAVNFWKYARLSPYYEQILVQLIKHNTPPPVVAPAPQPQPVPQPEPPVIEDRRSGARKFADKVLPHGTKRRTFAKFILPKGSLRWWICKQVYYIFQPQYRPQKVKKSKKNKNNK